ncbi:MAG: ADP-ribosylglycohydrolase family protein [Succinivibrio sp.]|nr:ADP-ribosylglycohydrolase family protein [Succinivibrio sp.]
MSAKQSDEEIRAALIASLRYWGRKYSNAGYGSRFYFWLTSDSTEPYGSFGNGSAMRVSAAGWLYFTLDETRRMARLSAEITHNHPEGIKGAEATASAIILARLGMTKAEIKEYVEKEFGYDLSRTCDEIRPNYHHVESCQETVPEAITAFLEGRDFEDVIRTAVSLGGDCDTLTCIAGSIAEAYYGVPEELVAQCRRRLPEDLLAVLDDFLQQKPSDKQFFRDPQLEGNDLIEQAIKKYHAEPSAAHEQAVVQALSERLSQDGHLLFLMAEPDEAGSDPVFRKVKSEDGTELPAAFTTLTQCYKGQSGPFGATFIDTLLTSCLTIETPGLIINPGGQAFRLNAAQMVSILQSSGQAADSVPEERITPDLLEDGSYLKRTVDSCRREFSALNVLRLMKVLRDSYVWIPCTATLSEDDYAQVKRTVKKTRRKKGAKGAVATGLNFQDNIRIVPDLLQLGEDFLFPVFSTAEEMGEQFRRSSKVQKPFLEVVTLAKHNQNKLKCIVINAFTAPFMLSLELCETIATMASSFKSEDKISDKLGMNNQLVIQA